MTPLKSIPRSRIFLLFFASSHSNSIRKFPSSGHPPWCVDNIYQDIYYWRRRCSRATHPAALLVQVIAASMTAMRTNSLHYCVALTFGLLLLVGTAAAQQPAP